MSEWWVEPRGLRRAALRGAVVALPVALFGAIEHLRGALAAGAAAGALLAGAALIEETLARRPRGGRVLPVVAAIACWVLVAASLPAAMANWFWAAGDTRTVHNLLRPRLLLPLIALGLGLGGPLVAAGAARAADRRSGCPGPFPLGLTDGAFWWYLRFSIGGGLVIGLLAAMGLRGERAFPVFLGGSAGALGVVAVWMVFCPLMAHALNGLDRVEERMFPA